MQLTIGLLYNEASQSICHYAGTIYVTVSSKAAYHDDFHNYIGHNFHDMYRRVGPRETSANRLLQDYFVLLNILSLSFLKVNFYFWYAWKQTGVCDRKHLTDTLNRCILSDTTWQ